MNLRATKDSVIVKIYDVDKEEKNTSKGGIFVGNTLKPASMNCGIGKVMSVGADHTWLKNGDVILFSWRIEEDENRFLGRDEEGEYRTIDDSIMQNNIYGVIKTKKSGESHIIPKRYYVMAIPEDDDLKLTRSIFQLPVTAVNPNDDIAKKFDIKIGDWIVCLPYSARPITIKRKTFFFIFLEDVIAVNKGRHKLSIHRKYVSQDLRLASRKNKVNLN